MLWKKATGWQGLCRVLETQEHGQWMKCWILLVFTYCDPTADRSNLGERRFLFAHEDFRPLWQYSLSGIKRLMFLSWWPTGKQMQRHTPQGTTPSDPASSASSHCLRFRNFVKAKHPTRAQMSNFMPVQAASHLRHTVVVGIERASSKRKSGGWGGRKRPGF